MVTCFSAGCCGRHGNRPVRYCKRCHVNQHSSEVGAAAETHLYQTSPPPINTRECGAEELVCTVEAVIRYVHSVCTATVTGHMPATLWNTFLHESINNSTIYIGVRILLFLSSVIVNTCLSYCTPPLCLCLFASSLLKEAEIHAEQREFELNRRRQMGLSSSHHSLDNIEFDNKEDDQHDQRLLSQFGIWFLVCNQAGSVSVNNRGVREGDNSVYGTWCVNTV